MRHVLTILLDRKLVVTRNILMGCFLFQAVQFKSAKKKKGMIIGFVGFESAEQLNTAIEVLPVLLLYVQLHVS